MVLRQGGTLAESEGEFESERDVDRRCFPADGNRPHSEWNRERETLPSRADNDGAVLSCGVAGEFVPVIASFLYVPIQNSRFRPGTTKEQNALLFSTCFEIICS